MLMVSRKVENTIRLPSDETSSCASSPWPEVICSGSPPVAAIFQTFMVPPRLEAKSMARLSGDQAGESASALS